jgi:histidine triad (HIT) family protein
MATERDCLFCQMASHELPAEMLHEDEQIFAVRDINPRAPLHVLIVPIQHISSARELTAEQGPLLARMVEVANRIAADEGLALRGYRLAFNVGEEGGQTIFHLHLHLLGGRHLGAEG